MKLIIKCYNQKSSTPQHSFYILSRGKNLGKPLEQPCPNCFVATTCDQELRQYYFWLLWALWQSKSFYKLHRGSVIEFITIGDLQNEIQKAELRSSSRSIELTESIKRMQGFINKKASLENHLSELLKLHRGLLISCLYSK